MLAISNGAKGYQQKLHDLERPTALLSSIFVSQHTDPKKRKPPTYGDFCFYKPTHDGDRPDYIYGSAYMGLVKQKKLPAWALFCFKDLSASALDDYEPLEYALIAQDAVLLHPEQVGPNSYRGLLLAQESASEQKRVFVNDKGQAISLTLPHVGTKVIAEEDVVLSL